MSKRINLTYNRFLKKYYITEGLSLDNSRNEIIEKDVAKNLIKILNVLITPTRTKRKKRRLDIYLYEIPKEVEEYISYKIKQKYKDTKINLIEN